MSDITFDEDQFGTGASSVPRTTSPAPTYTNNQMTSQSGQGVDSSGQPKLVQILLNTGIVKTPKSANNVLLGIMICCLAITLIVVVFFL